MFRSDQKSKRAILLNEGTRNAEITINPWILLDVSLAIVDRLVE